MLCFDKTGTLTEGRLRVRRVSDGTTTLPIKDPSHWLREVIAAAWRACPDYDRGRRHLPHPTDRAIMHAAERLGMDPAEGLGGWERVDELPFEPSRGYHAVLGRHPGGQHLSVKGAPEIVLDRCDTWRRPGEEAAAFDEAARAVVDQEVERLARTGHRVLAVAERAASGRVDLTESRIRNLRLLGLTGIADPVRRTAAEAVDRLRGAGIQIIMITGDHPSTAEAIAAELGVLDGHVMTGLELDDRDLAELAAELPRVAVFARVSPAQKARVVQALQAGGRVVAVTGDGANDAPAIRMADVGIALGERATPAARETADMVVTDDRIETITDAIADCRAMWRSARDALAVLLGGNLGEIAFTLGGGLTGGGSPLNVRQLLLVNLLTDMLPALALAVRRPPGLTREDLLREGPETSLGDVLTRDVTTRAVTTAGAAETAWLLARLSGTRGQANTTGLVALVSTQLVQTIAAGGRSPLVLGSGLASLAALAALAAIVQTPGLSHFFGSRPLLPHSWAIAFGAALIFALAAIVMTRRKA
ncbi:HAD-IC family P-type ATPase [Actinomadura sp. 6N118]|uniref:HAD-IC family P-type ATPase n=1 Tax=Actinomadura sp. 6N118 TaxID=3375151 RepID=UPI003790AB1A